MINDGEGNGSDVLECAACDQRFNLTSRLENAGHEVSPHSQIAKYSGVPI